jgi:FMN phosphatase YigB (HAD superfamily)
MFSKEYVNKYQSFVFNLDDVIYPERDFLLQVYYLFAQFMEYSEQLPAQELLGFMKSTYEVAGRKGLFKKTAEKFTIGQQYETNFELLHQTARLPLKLLLYPAVQEFMQDLVANKKDLYLLVSGTPEGQLNKIRQLEWGDLAANLRVYFSEEIIASLSANPLRYVIDVHDLQPEQTLVLGLTAEDEAVALSEGIKFLKADKLFLN